MQKPTPSYAITAPTMYPDAAYAGTHHLNRTNASQINSVFDVQTIDTQTERDIRPVTSTKTTTTESDDSSEIDMEDAIKVPFKQLIRIKGKESHTTASSTTTQTTEPSTSHGTTASDQSAEIHYGFDIGSFDGLDDAISNSEEERQQPTEAPIKQSSKKPSNGHMPQAPHYYDDNVNAPDQSILVRTKLTQTYNHIQPTSTIKMNHPEQTNQMTKYVTGDAKTLTVTTTKTTVVRSHTITLTKTKTSTLVDTITHTLVKPTRVSHEPTIKPTIYTAPVTLKKVLGSTASIVPNPSFSIYANIGTDGEQNALYYCQNCWASIEFEIFILI